MAELRITGLHKDYGGVPAVRSVDLDIRDGAFRLAGAPVIAALQAHDVSQPGERISINVNITRASIIDRAAERAL
jgi:hypothetical protein